MAEGKKKGKKGVAVCLSRLPEFRHDHEEHTIPVGQVVIVEEWDEGEWRFGNLEGDICLGIKGRLKMIVVGHHRDCDGTPLYILSFKPVGYPLNKYTYYDEGSGQTIHPFPGLSDFMMGLKYGMWIGFKLDGINADSLTVCEGEFIPMKHEDVYAYEDSLREGFQ